MRNRQQSPPRKKQKRDVDSSDDDDYDIDAQQDYQDWRTQVYEKYNSIKKRNLIQSIDKLKTIMKPKRYSHVNECRKNKDCTNGMWNSSVYLLKHVRLCVLGHRWNLLRSLVLALSKQDKKYHCYVKEMSFHVARMAGMEEPAALLELEHCFATDDTGKENRFDIWYSNE